MDSKFGFNGVIRLVSIGLLAAIPGRFLACAAGLPTPAEASDQAATDNAIVPVTWLERDSYNWDERHAQVLELQKTLDPEVVLIGDSITHFWAGPPLSSQQNGPKAWADTFGGHRVLNMGFGWDRTQNVLWRLEHGEMDGTHPKVVVLNIGSNNFSRTRNARDNSLAEVAEAIAGILDHIHKKSPQSRIIVMGVFPRGFNANDPFRARIAALNGLLARQLAAEPLISFLDISDQLVTKEGAIDRDIMSDGVHPTEAGYALWGKALRAAGVLTGAPPPVTRPPVGKPAPQPLALSSPDGRIEVRLQAQGALTCAVTADGRPLLNASRLGLKLHDGTEFGRDVEIVEASRAAADTTWENRFGKRRQVRDQHNELRLVLREKSSAGRRFEVVFRAFNDGVGFRYSIPAQAGVETFVVDRELTEFAFAGNHPCFAAEHDKGGFKGPQEWEFKPRHLADITPSSIIGLPLLVQTPNAWVALTESDLLDWAGMWIGGTAVASGPTNNGVTLAAALAPCREGDGLVVATTPHQSPWRVLMIGREPGRLIESDLVLNLASPCELADTSWIKPGMMAWDHWWSGDVKMDTTTLKEYIQLAADMGWPYQLVDWQWYGEFNKPTSDITRVNPAVDLNEVRRFAHEKGVRLWLWLYWTDADRGDAYEKAFALYEQWGIAGVKIDFMDSDDQFMVNWYEKLTRAAAKRHLMINFHGAYKPTGLNRTLPNQLTREGVLGNEYNKWSTRVTPEHKLTLPFTRFLAGPADFTPGGFLNRQPAQFKPQTPALVQGTRTAELALFVVYDSPICCVCDHPDHLRNQPGADFLKLVPTVWDDTRVPDGAVAQHLVMVRRSGNQWFLGALTDREARQISVKLDFLGPGPWKVRVWKDAADSDHNAEHLETEERKVTAADSLLLKLAPSGGTVALFQESVHQ